jgi:hypothetical protein
VDRVARLVHCLAGFALGLVEDAFFFDLSPVDRSSHLPQPACSVLPLICSLSVIETTLIGIRIPVLPLSRGDETDRSNHDGRSPGGCMFASTARADALAGGAGGRLM